MTDADQAQPTRDVSHTYQLADLLLRERGGLAAFVAERRLGGMSWRKVARDLYLATDKRIDVAHETLRAWFPDEPQAAAS